MNSFFFVDFQSLFDGALIKFMKVLNAQKRFFRNQLQGKKKNFYGLLHLRITAEISQIWRTEYFKLFKKKILRPIINRKRDSFLIPK